MAEAESPREVRALAPGDEGVEALLAARVVSASLRELTRSESKVGASREARRRVVPYGAGVRCPSALRSATGLAGDGVDMVGGPAHRSKQRRTGRAPDMATSERIIVDFDQHSPEYQAHSAEISHELRAKCPVTWSEHHGGF